MSSGFPFRRRTSRNTACAACGRGWEIPERRPRVCTTRNSRCLARARKTGACSGSAASGGANLRPGGSAPGQELCFGSAGGRSSHGFSPCLFLFDASGGCRFAAVCWPGNWELKVSKEGEVRFVFPCGGAELGPHAELALPAVLTGEDARGLEALRGTGWSSRKFRLQRPAPARRGWKVRHLRRARRGVRRTARKKGLVQP